MFWGAARRFTSTIASAGMPPFQIHMLPQRMEKMTPRRHHHDVLRRRERDADRALFRARPAHARNCSIVAGADAARDRHQFPRLLAGAAHPTGPFYRIAYALMFAISAALLVQGARPALWRGLGFETRAQFDACGLRVAS